MARGKTYQLDQAVRDMSAQVGPRTLILSLFYGITSEDALAAAFGREKVPYAMILGIHALREGNATSFSSGGLIHFGDARNAEGAWSPACVAHIGILQAHRVGLRGPRGDYSKPLVQVHDQRGD